MSSSDYVTSVNGLNMFDKLDTSPIPPFLSSSSSTFLSAELLPFDNLNVTSSTVTIAAPSQTPTIITTAASEGTDAFVVLPGPEDVLLFNSTNGLYQQSVTLTARMYPIEATAAKSIWGLPTLIWGILIGTIVILSVILATLFFCCWLQPRTRKLLNSGYYVGSSVSHSSIVPKSQTGESNQLVMPLSIGICPPQYSAPPPPTGGNSSSGGGAGASGNNHHSNQQSCPSSSAGIPCHPSAGNSNAAAYHGKYGSSPQFAHQQYHQQQQQQQFQHHHQCIHHQQQQQQQQQYHAHYAHIQQHQQHPQQQQGSPYATTQHQQTLQQYYNQQHQQHQQQQQQQHMQQHQHQHQKLTHYVHPAQQQALQHQQQREHQIQQHHYHHQQQQQQQHHHHQQQKQQQQGQLVHHKSMWAINPLYASSGVINDSTSGDGSGENDEEGGNTSYRTRSLPSWGKNKQRPLSNADDLEELYAKVNFSKKRRNRMRNDEAAIIALCRSRSQNLSSLPLTDQDAVVVYDERTAL